MQGTNGCHQLPLSLTDLGPLARLQIDHDRGQILQCPGLDSSQALLAS